MTHVPQDETLAPDQKLHTEDGPMGNWGNQINVPLTATRNGNTISITGNGGANLAVNSGAHRFVFTLTDNSGANVQFASVDTCDNTTSCPPPSGENSQQIVAVVMQNTSSPKYAAFTDNNSNLANNGPMSVSYQWNFTCDSPCTVGSFDPIIENGGRTGPS